MRKISVVSASHENDEVDSKLLNTTNNSSKRMSCANEEGKRKDAVF
jgi:hypothetical protein